MEFGKLLHRPWFVCCFTYALREGYRAALGYSPKGKLFNPLSTETRSQNRMMYIVYNMDTGKAWCPVQEVNASDGVWLGCW